MDMGYTWLFFPRAVSPLGSGSLGKLTKSTLLFSSVLRTIFYFFFQLGTLLEMSIIS